MPKGVNKVTLLGHIGKDPEIRTTQGGTTVANLSLATSEHYKQGEEWVDHTEPRRLPTDSGGRARLRQKGIADPHRGKAANAVLGR